jgi:hypothetical protein
MRSSELRIFRTLTGNLLVAGLAPRMLGEKPFSTFSENTDTFLPLKCPRCLDKNKFGL